MFRYIYAQKQEQKYKKETIVEQAVLRSFPFFHPLRQKQQNKKIKNSNRIF